MTLKTCLYSVMLTFDRVRCSCNPSRRSFEIPPDALFLLERWEIHYFPAVCLEYYVCSKYPVSSCILSRPGTLSAGITKLQNLSNVCCSGNICNATEYCHYLIVDVSKIHVACKLPTACLLMQHQKLLYYDSCYACMIQQRQ